MSALLQHLAVVPIVLPLLAGALLLVVDEPRHAFKASVSAGAIALLLATAIALVAGAAQPATHVYALGGWAAPAGIVLVTDRLAALMVLLASGLGAAAWLYSLAKWQRLGPHFHPLLLFLLAGLNGAFLTGDLFNLFVFFELLLAASYGLALHGGGAARVRAGLHYIVINLAASLLFLVGVSLLYGMAGTLNMADLAVRLHALPPEDRPLLELGAAVLGVAFLVKAGMWPLGFWLPATYSASSAPAAALFCILSKVGIYAVLRVSYVVFGGLPAADLIAWGGMATLVFGMVGMLGSQDLGRIASFSLVTSAGTVLAAVGVGGAGSVAAALLYVLTSTLGTSALFLLVELVERSRPAGASVLAVTADAFGLDADEDEDGDAPVGVLVPASLAVLGLAFGATALVVAGLPPLGGFVAKFTLMASLLQAGEQARGAGLVVALMLLSGLASVIALARAGVRAFWAGDAVAPRVRVIEMLPVALLVGACLLVTVLAGPVLAYLQLAAEGLHTPGAYVREVLR